jgi:hypothetical protein
VGHAGYLGGRVRGCHAGFFGWKGQGLPTPIEAEQLAGRRHSQGVFLQDTTINVIRRKCSCTA